MGSLVASTTAGQAAAHDALVAQFARLMRERYGARVFLFGSRARGTAGPVSDYDVVAVAPSFAAQPAWRRAPGWLRLWRAAGGWGVDLDLLCYTPAEFRAERRGLGVVAQAEARGELREVGLPSGPTPPGAAGSTPEGSGSALSVGNQ